MKLKILLMATTLSVSSMIAADMNATAKPTTKEEGIKYIKMLGGALKKELKTHMKKDPTGLDALGFCTGSADRITKEVNAKLPSYAKVRRTALKLRNESANKADEIDEKIMKGYEDAIAAKTFTPKDIKVVEDGNVTRVYKPLITKPVCLKCHGSNLSPEISKSLKGAYPHDKAIDFKEGSLRGVIVSEIKKHQ